jgi:phospholipid transport system substrate-binding protein
MRIFLLSLCVIAVALVTTTGSVHAKDGPGVRVVRKANQKISHLLKQKAPAGSAKERSLAAKVTKSVRGFLDIEELGRRALVDHWAKLDASKRAEFMKLLRSVIEKNYVRGLRARVSYQVAYLSEKKQDKTLIVSTQIKTKRRGRIRSIDVDYVLVRRGASWRAFDIVTNEVGLVANYRAQFNRIIAKEGFDGLLARVRKKAAAGS